MKSLIIFLVVLFASVRMARAVEETSFQFDVVSFQTRTFSTDSARVDVYVAVPYSLITFLNAVERYVADYALTLTITDETADTTIHTRRQEMSVSLTKSEWEKLEELNIMRADASQFSFTLRQGKEYRFSITIRDLAKKRDYVKTKTFTVRRFPPDSVSSSDLVVYRSRVGSRIVPLIGEEASELHPSEGGVFFELYAAPQSTPYYHVVRIALADAEGEEVGHTVGIVVSTGGPRMPVFTSLSQMELWKGSYVLESYLLTDSKDTLLSDPKDLREHAIGYGRKLLQVTAERGVPLVSSNIDEAIEQLFYIATGGAYDSLRRAETNAEKRRAIIAYWDGRKPNPHDDYNPPMEIFYRRVKYANDNFKGMQSGWRSDRGKIYIMLGAPTNSQRYSYEVNQRPYEVWEYYDLNQRYYFVDQFLVGDYRLATPAPPPGTFNWQRSSY